MNKTITQRTLENNMRHYIIIQGPQSPFKTWKHKNNTVPTSHFKNKERQWPKITLPPIKVNIY